MNSGERENADRRAIAVGWKKRACERRPTIGDVDLGGPALASLRHAVAA